MIKRCLIALLLATTSLACWSDESHLRYYDRISFSVTASQEVENDTLVALLYAQHEAEKAGDAAALVSREISRAMTRARTTKGVKVQTLDYNTTPVYGDNAGRQVVSWRVRQSIRLESMDSNALSSLIGKLQTGLALGQISYSISPKRRKAVEEQLIRQAIDNFQHRAELISDEMDARKYHLVEMSIHTSGAAPRPYAMRGQAINAMPVPPVIEAGAQRVTVTVTGTVELQ